MAVYLYIINFFFRVNNFLLRIFHQNFLVKENETKEGIVIRAFFLLLLSLRLEFDSGFGLEFGLGLVLE